MSSELLCEIAPAQSQTVKLPHVPELDGIRGITAFGVFAHHLLFTAFPHPDQYHSPIAQLVFGLSSAAGLRMDIFFVLSGFLITSILVRDRAKPHFYWNFYWRRSLRILPLYLITLAAVAAFVPAARGYVLLSALFLTNFDHLFHIAEAGPFWTLAIEEHFYLVWPQFARHLNTTSLRKLALGTAVVCLVLRLAAAAAGHHNFRFTFFHCDGLALGALLACQRIQGLSFKFGVSQRKLRHSTLYLGLAGSLLITLPLIQPPTNRWGMAAEALRMTGTALLGYCFIRLSIEHTGSRTLAILRSRPAIFFSSISYCLYLSNLFLADLYDHVTGPLATGTPFRFAARFIVVLAMTIGVCMVSRSLIEQPAFRLRRVVLKHGD